MPAGGPGAERPRPDPAREARSHAAGPGRLPALADRAPAGAPGRPCPGGGPGGARVPPGGRPGRDRGRPGLVHAASRACPTTPLRNQGDCGSCWVWASTALAEVALNSQYGITDRLSIQYLQSNNLAQPACWGGDLTEFCDWYNNNAQSPANPNPGVLVPWSNAGGGLRGRGHGLLPDGQHRPPGRGHAPAAVFRPDPVPPDPGRGRDPSVTQAQAIADIQAALLNHQAVGFSFFTNFGASDGFDAFWDNQPEIGHMDQRLRERHGALAVQRLGRPHGDHRGLGRHRPEPRQPVTGSS